MRVLISGGCKNGKSSYAERIAIKLAGDNKRYYVATMVPYDEEDFDRIRKHREERKNLGFETVEINDNLDVLKNIVKDEVILLDSITALVYNYMAKKLGHNCDECENKCKFYSGETKIYQYVDAKRNNYTDADRIVSKIIYDINRNVINNEKNVVFVTDYIYSNDITLSNYSKTYMYILAEVCKYIAKISDVVIDVRYTIPEIYKGEDFEVLNGT